MSYLRGECGVKRWEDESNESVYESCPDHSLAQVTLSHDSPQLELLTLLLQWKVSLFAVKRSCSPVRWYWLWG